MKKKKAPKPPAGGKPAAPATPAVPAKPAGGTGSSNLVGSGGRLFANPVPGADETSFQVNNTSSAYYNSPYYLKHQTQLQPVPPPRVPQPSINLGDVAGAGLVAG